MSDALVERGDLYRAIVAAAQEGVWVIDREGKTVVVNEQMAAIVGVSIEELQGAAMWRFLEEETADRLRGSLAAGAEAIRGCYEFPFLRLDGERRWVCVSAAPLTDSNGRFTAALGMCVDVTARRGQESELRDLALHDTLTGLPNRSLLTDRLNHAVDRHERLDEDVALLFCDIDRFKLVNDNAGHAAGDRLLVQAAARLRTICRDEDTVARFGGDEFIVLRPGADAYVACRLAQEILAAFADPFDLDDTPVTLDLSIGVSSSVDVPAAELLQAADRALHRAKANGRGRIEVHDTAMRRSTEGQLRLLTDLRHAIDTDALDLHYQPIIHADGTVTAAEALLRWTHQELGAISPAEMIRLAENNNLMRKLGDWILHRACVDIARLNTPELRVGINLSAHQLAGPGIVDCVQRALRVSGLSPSRLTLEVTETSVLQDPQTTRPTLQQLKELGIRIALDDFGTGYSSLTHLREFPVDVIKIDRSFVAGVATNRGDLAIVATLTNLAATVGLDVVAEGVETAEQAEILRRLGVTYAQGFLWSPAVPLADLPALLRPDRFNAIPRDVPRRRPRLRQPETLPEYAADRARILAMHRSGASPTTIAAALNHEGRLTPRGTRWQRTTVAEVVANAAFPDLQAEHSRSTAPAYPGAGACSSNPERRGPAKRSLRP